MTILLFYPIRKTRGKAKSYCSVITKVARLVNFKIAKPTLRSTQQAKYNGKTDLALVCPITSQIKGYPFEVQIPGESGVRGVILSDQVRSLDWRARESEWINTLPTSTIEKVIDLIKALL